MAYFADDVYGALPGPNGVVTAMPTGATAPVNPQPGTPSASTAQGARHPDAGGTTRLVHGTPEAALSALSLRGFFQDPTGWLVLCIGAAFVLAHYDATGRWFP